MTPRDLLEARYDGRIPAHELDRLRYPTRANQIERAHKRIAWAKASIAHHMDQWRLQRTYALVRWGGVTIDALRSIAGIHMPHLRYWRRERLRWQTHLAELER